MEFKMEKLIKNTNSNINDDKLNQKTKATIEINSHKTIEELKYLES